MNILNFQARAAEAKERREALAEEKKKSAEKSEKVRVLLDLLTAMSFLFYSQLVS